MTVQLLGTCESCPISPVTLKQGVERHPARARPRGHRSRRHRGLIPLHDGDLVERALEGRAAGDRAAHLAGRGRRADLAEVMKRALSAHRPGLLDRHHRSARRRQVVPHRPSRRPGAARTTQGRGPGDRSLEPVLRRRPAGRPGADAVHATDPGVFIRSMATRGHLGGISLATPEAMRALDAVGNDIVIIETVGVGQAEVEITDACDTTLVVVNPGWGDAVQAAKAGLDGDRGRLRGEQGRPARARGTRVRELKQMLELSDAAWKPEIIQTVAIKSEGIDELWAAIAATAPIRRTTAYSSSDAAAGSHARSARSSRSATGTALETRGASTSIEELAIRRRGPRAGPLRSRRPPYRALQSGLAGTGQPSRIAGMADDLQKRWQESYAGRQAAGRRRLRHAVQRRGRSSLLARRARPEASAFPGEYPFTAGHLPDRATADGCGPCDSSPVSGRPRQTNERYKFLLEHGPDGPVRRVRHAHADGPRFRRPAFGGRGRSLRRRGRLARRHGDPVRGHRPRARSRRR